LPITNHGFDRADMLDRQMIAKSGIDHAARAAVQVIR
jgi:hypothetical protein